MIRVTGLENGYRHCDGVTRRSFLQAGALGLGGLTLPELLRAREAGAAEKPDTAVILLWLSGGPGHMETWDPKPEAPSEWRGPFGAIKTNVDGIQFGELLPQSARMMDRLAVIRGVNHGTGDHTKGNHWMLTGWEGPNFNDATLTQRNPAMGSVTARLRGPNRPGMAPYVAVPHLKGGTDNFFHYHAYAGATHNPFVANADPNDKGYAVRDLNPASGLSFKRLQDRRAFLEKFDRFRREGEAAVAERDGAYQRAFDLLTGPSARAAFDISAEGDSIRDRYGRHTFGQSALLARRLVEAGVTFVTVNCVPWDHHGTFDRYKTEEGAKLLIPPLDRAMAALVEDLVQRGLFDRTLVVAMGEFGRTPKMNGDGGRDHWGDTFSVLMANGRMKMGQAIGASNAKGEYPVERPASPQDVLATVYHHLGIDPHATTFMDRTARPIPLLDGGAPIRELLR
ncbi:MAG TPA: DUF1501 domain-containing protein [Armatimonadota bacterium]|nr:DUF1501 domain-containing protein [Armatimonadota bacterium]